MIDFGAKALKSHNVLNSLTLVIRLKRKIFDGGFRR